MFSEGCHMCDSALTSWTLSLYLAVGIKLLRLVQIFQSLDSHSFCMMLSLYICYFREQSLNETIFPPRSLILQFSFCFLRLTSPFQLGLGTLRIQIENQPLRPHWLHQHSLRLSWWLACCFRRQRRHHYALGPERGQTPVLSGGRWHCQCPCFLTKPILVVRRHR